MPNLEESWCCPHEVSFQLKKKEVSRASCCSEPLPTQQPLPFMLREAGCGSTGPAAQPHQRGWAMVFFLLSELHRLLSDIWQRASFQLDRFGLFLLLTDCIAIDKWVSLWQTVSMLSGEGQQRVTRFLETVIKGDKLWPIWGMWLTLIQTLSWLWLAVGSRHDSCDWQQEQPAKTNKPDCFTMSHIDASLIQKTVIRSAIIPKTPFHQTFVCSVKWLFPLDDIYFCGFTNESLVFWQ